MRFIALLAVVLLFISFCVRWDWNECRKVGHSRMYCYLHAGEGK